PVGRLLVHDAPTAISSGTGLAASIVGGFAPTLIGTVAAPVAPTPAILVTTELDVVDDTDRKTSLREAIKDVNDQAVPGLSRIGFGDNMGGKTITRGADGSLRLNRTVTIQTTTLSGQRRDITVTRDPAEGNFSLFTVANGTALLEGLSLTGGGGP